MLAAITAGAGGPVVVEELEDPSPRSGFVLVEIRAALLTGRDGAVYSGAQPAEFPLVQGGTGAGTLRTGGGYPVAGSKVIVWPRVSCRRCDACRAARPHDCDQIEVLGVDRAGTLAGMVSVPRHNVVPVPGDLGPAEAAAAVEYADGWRLLHAAGPIEAGMRVLVVGAGPVWSAAAQIATAHDAEVASADPPGATDLVEDFDLVLAIRSDAGPLVPRIAPGGTLALFDEGLQGRLTLDAAEVAAKRQRIVGVGPAIRKDLVDTLRWLEESGFSPTVGAVSPLAEAGDELARLAADEERPSIVTIP